MKSLTLLSVVAAAILTGCHSVPVHESYVSGCYDCDYGYPTYRYDRTYVRDYSTPFALTTGVALGYILADGHYHRPHRVIHHHRPLRHKPRHRWYRR